MNDIFLTDGAELSGRDLRKREDAFARHEQMVADRIKDTLTDKSKIVGVLQDYIEKIAEPLSNLSVACYQFRKTIHGAKLDNDESDVIREALNVQAVLQECARQYVEHDLPTLAEIAEDK